jgi:hypothetical protein
MAKAGRFEFDIDFSKVVSNLEVAVSRVQRGTKKATKAACEAIKEESLAQVPRKTDTLADSFYYEIQGSYVNFTAEIGYGGNGDPINPHTGLHASQYMVADHEDLSAIHSTGKAKFLEDPVTNYRSRMLNDVASTVKTELG